MHRFADRKYFSVEARLNTFQDSFYTVDGGDQDALDLATNGYFISKPLELVFTCSQCLTTVENIVYILPDTPAIGFEICDCPVDPSIITKYYVSQHLTIRLYGNNIQIQSRFLNMPPFCIYCKMVTTMGHIPACLFYNHSVSKKSLSTCVVCNEPATIMYPCKHVACCPSCTLSITKCPICRASVDYFKILNF